MKTRFKKGIQTFGRSLLLPIAVLAPVGMIMGLANALTQEYLTEKVPWLGNAIFQEVLTSLGTISQVVFDNIPLLFAMGVAYGMNKRDKGIAVFASVIGYLTMQVAMRVYLIVTGTLVDDPDLMRAAGQGLVLGIHTVRVEAAGGIIAGLLAAYACDKWYTKELPLAFAFFGGKKFVAIATFVLMIPIGFLVPIVWGGFTAVLVFISPIFMNDYFGVGLYWTAHRLCIPFGLHHVLASVVRFTEAGGTYMINGQPFVGILPAANEVLFNQGPGSQAWDEHGPKLFSYLASGQMLTTLFRIPAMGLAFYHTAFKENKKVAKAAILTVVLTAFLGNITEPIEFSFLFIAPMLFIAYAVMCGIMALPLQFLDVTIGYIRGTIFDFGIFGLLYDDTNWWQLVLLGLANSVVFYFFFRFAISKWKFETLGREKAMGDRTLLLEKRYDELAVLVIQGLGGKENIKNVDNCVSRLRVDLVSNEAVDRDILKDTGTSGIFFPQEGHIHIVFGPYVEFVRNAVDDAMKKPVG
ncbi:PTS transporter subunit EIIC [Tessaracoccus caeni]|uniref:PTS transporter subunit EIIC n=1 Tax=Tessaracoccus caeni TaxID=3031239 RepID=UPI0023DB5E8A|nr:PTS transporter subunit EIIC [Tessaracoccus caeni]MDF1487214.1 PTS transporter subunit EIIC [Tessaracoccus caeni]